MVHAHSGTSLSEPGERAVDTTRVNLKINFAEPKGRVGKDTHDRCLCVCETWRRRLTCGTKQALWGLVGRFIIFVAVMVLMQNSGI